MGITNRPYIGTYVPNKRKVVQYTPDALVYLNGDTAMAGCRTCRSRIDIQQFVTSVSVDAGTEPGASSASISLSIPRHYGDSLLRDGNTVLRNGLEVHVYYRGYFPMTGLAQGESVGGVNLGEVPQYPYYPVFHGVVTSVSHEYSGGYYTASLSCSGMLHFWQYMMLASNGAVFGARPENSGVRPNLRGHIFTGMSPFSIIYSLYRDTAGAAAGVGFALQSRTNYRSNSSVTGDSLYSMTLKYWEARFMSGMYRLRMHGASGSLFTSSQQAYLARLNSAQLRFIGTVAPARGSRSARSVADVGNALQILDIDRDGNRVRVTRSADLQYLSNSGGGRRDYGVNVAQMQAFVNDISQYGQVNFFESTYESKLDIATQVSNICGYEFYQDMDGDLVFKPPLYNLDTSSSRVYRIEPEDIISISFTENEPEATYMICKGGPFQNLRGAVDEAEWGVRSTYIDYRLVAQFGWREGTFESNYYNNARSAYWAAVANLDRVNKGVNSCSITIPLRPEIRPGYPVYISNIDCFYYVESLSHSLSFGSSATTTLNLVARRRKFMPPGNPSAGVEGVALENTASPPRALQYLDSAGMPRLLGFPNVVMALDPTRINPLFFVIGFLAEESSLLEERRRGRSGSRLSTERRDQFITNFVMILWNASVLSVGSQSANDGASPDFRRAESDAEELRVLRGPWYIPAFRGSDGEERGREITFEEMQRGLTALVQIRNRSRTRIAIIDRNLRQVQQSLFNLQASIREGSEEEALIQRLGQLNRERELLTQFLAPTNQNAPALSEFFEEIRSVQSDTLNRGRGQGSGRLLEGISEGDRELASLLNFLIRTLQERNPYNADRDMFTDSTGTINNTAGILELLSDRKAAAGVNTPGYYRYYSASHFNESQQGYEPLTSSSEEASSTEDRNREREEASEQARSEASASGSSQSLQEDLGSLRAELADAEREVAEVLAELRRGQSGSPSPALVERVADLRSRISNLETRIGSGSRSFRPEADLADLRPAGSRASEVDRRVVTVVRLADEEAEGARIPPERRNDFVSLEDREPVRGLNVRTFTSLTPTPTPTNRIFALSFEERRALRLFRGVIPRITNVQTAPGFLRGCIGPSDSSSQSTSVSGSVADALYGKLSPATKANANITCGELIREACAGISGVSGPDGNNLNAGDYSGGSPTNTATYNGVDVTSKTLNSLNGFETPVLETFQKAVIRAKANALTSQLGFAYRVSLSNAIAILADATLAVETRRENAGRAVLPYFRQVAVLTGGRASRFGNVLILERVNSEPIRASINQYSPVFPVSDAKGYEHYGTYQYGRGLSIEAGGNYQRLMALDPFQYVDPRLADEYVSALQSSNQSRQDEVLGQLATALQDARETSPTADSFVLQFLEDGRSAEATGDETTMITAGLRNYLYTNRDSVTKLPVSNAAFLLADLQPFDRQEACDCRGAEADLSLAAYVAGVETNTFVSIGGEEGSPTSDNVAQNWVKQQMLLAADSWVLSQAALRGLSSDQGRGSLFDSARGILGLSQALENSVTGVDRALSNAANPRLNRLNQIAEGVDSSFRRIGSD